MKKRIITIAATVIVLAACIFVNVHINYPDIKVTVYNNTNVTLKGLIITYDDLHPGKKIDVLSRHKNCNVNINLPEDYSKGTVCLHYYDKDNKEHKTVIVPEFTKGKDKNIKVHINKVTEKNTLEIEV